MKFRLCELVIVSSSEAQTEWAGPGSSVCTSDWYSGGRGFNPLVRQHSFVEIGHEIISMVILSLPLIQVGQLSVTGESCKYWFTARV